MSDIFDKKSIRKYRKRVTEITELTQIYRKTTGDGLKLIQTQANRAAGSVVKERPSAPDIINVV